MARIDAEAGQARESGELPNLSAPGDNRAGTLITFRLPQVQGNIRMKRCLAPPAGSPKAINATFANAVPRNPTQPLGR
jgi:hypothetical protein